MTKPGMLLPAPTVYEWERVFAADRRHAILSKFDDAIDALGQPKTETVVLRDVEEIVITYKAAR
jgi:hypothetical protein